MIPDAPIARSLARLALVLAAGACTSLGHAQVYKCTDATGKTTYADVPCDTHARPHKLPDDPTKKSATNPGACAQLHDELNRLAAEAERNAQRGRSESASSAKRRKQLTQQYESRCVGVSRSESRTK